MHHPHNTYVLGASDPEMAEIAGVLEAAGATVVYATAEGRRCHPGNANHATGTEPALPPGTEVVVVECRLAASTLVPVAVIDHHGEGDPGFGRPPAEYLAASSIGQVLARLGLKATERQRLIAAADHCLGAAYQGRCPGVDPSALGEYRLADRAAFQGVAVDTLRAAVEETTRALHEAPRLVLGGAVFADMRRDTPFAELPEAATRAGVAYVSGPLRDHRGNRDKYTASGDSTAIWAFLDQAASLGLTDVYGDPARGFAGGYAPRPAGA